MTAMSVLACPVCKTPLYRREREWACTNRHSFDIARKGYVNLLLAHQKESKEPGDRSTMVESRRKFLDTGYYTPLADCLTALVSEIKPNVILDAGCGEGYFLHYLRRSALTSLLIGVDISRAAVNAAAGRDKETTFAVASTFHLPIVDNSIDCVLRIMAPCDDAEVSRVLKAQGQYITVTPGPDHLLGLKQLIYAHTDKNPSKVVKPDGFVTTQQEKVYFTLQLNGEGISRLLAMTPYYWSIDSSTRQRVATTPELFTPVDFDVTVFQKI